MIEAAVRETNRLFDHDDRQNAVYFATRCIQNHQPVLWRRNVGELIALQNEWHNQNGVRRTPLQLRRKKLK